MVALLAVASGAQAQELRWSSSLGYASGAYMFDEEFRTVSLLTSLSLRAGRLEFSGSLPVLAQNGTAVSYIAGRPLPTGGPDHGVVQRRQSGSTIGVGPGRRGRGGSANSALLGYSALTDVASDSATVAGTGAYDLHVADPVVGASVAAYEGLGVVRSLGIDAWAKAPMASIESGVGSGAWDYGVGGAVVLGMGQSIVFANAAWWVLGDMPDLELRDALFYSVAVGRSLSPRWSILASGNASSRIIATSDPPASFNVLLSRRLSDGASLSVSAGVGLTETASAFTAGMGWSTRLLGAPR
jgi:hypothetical protein